MITEDLYEQMTVQIKNARRLAIEYGVSQGLQRAFLLVFTSRFGPAPDDVAAIVERTADTATLDRWLRQVASAGADDLLADVRGTGARVSSSP